MGSKIQTNYTILMKKSFLFLALAATFAFSTCSSDVDGGYSCESCMAQEVSVEICDNGDGTYTPTVDGVWQTLQESELEGLTPKQLGDSTCEALNVLSNPL